jgi:hypothetical protein
LSALFAKKDLTIIPTLKHISECILEKSLLSAVYALKDLAKAAV